MYAQSQYNSKLFSGGIRAKLHRMRFDWVRQHVEEWHDGYSLFELGCYDCRSVRYLPKPKRYLGADSNWEGGLDAAKLAFANEPWMQFEQVESAQDLAPYAQDSFDYSLSLETLEHVPPEHLEGYIQFMAQVTRKKLLISVPVEIGPVFLIKHLCKRLITAWRSPDADSFTWREVWYATIGQSDKVARDQHKGFDYRALVAMIERHFTITHVEGLPFTPLPMLSFQVGIVAVPKQKEAQ